MPVSYVISFAILSSTTSWFTYVESTGTLKADPNADLVKDSNEINAAFGFWNTHEDVFKRILPFRSCKQRKEIYKKLDSYKRSNANYYNHNDGDIYISVMDCFFCEPAEYYQTWFYRAMWDGIFCLNIKSLTELLCMLSIEDQAIKDSAIGENQFREYYRRGRLRRYKVPSLLDIWRQNVDDDFGNWGVEMFTRKRDLQAKADPEAAKNDAKLLLEETKKDLDDGRQKLDEILIQRSLEQVKLIMDEFKKINDNKDLVDEIKDQLGGDIEHAYCDLITLIREGRDNYMATRLHETMDNLGTDDMDLGRIITYHADLDLLEIANAYKAKYGKSLRERIKEDTSGFEEDFLIAFLGDLP